VGCYLLIIGFDRLSRQFSSSLTGSNEEQFAARTFLCGEILIKNDSFLNMKKRACTRFERPRGEE
jgi:hypothetical protein